MLTHNVRLPFGTKIIRDIIDFKQPKQMRLSGML